MSVRRQARGEERRREILLATLSLIEGGGVACVTHRACSSGAMSRAYDLTAQRLVSYLVSTMPPGNVRVSTRFKLTQLSSAVKNGAPPPTKTG